MATRFIQVFMVFTVMMIVICQSHSAPLSVDEEDSKAVSSLEKNVPIIRGGLHLERRASTSGLGSGYIAGVSGYQRGMSGYNRAWWRGQSGHSTHSKNIRTVPRRVIIRRARE